MSKQYGAQRLLSVESLNELPDKGWKLGNIDNLLKSIHQTGIRLFGSRQR